MVETTLTSVFIHTMGESNNDMMHHLMTELIQKKGKELLLRDVVATSSSTSEKDSVCCDAFVEALTNFQKNRERLRSSVVADTTMAQSISDETAPLVHAIGGSVGSALSLLLFYPLERVRLEMMLTRHRSTSDNSNHDGSGREREGDGKSIAVSLSSRMEKVPSSSLVNAIDACERNKVEKRSNTVLDEVTPGSISHELYEHSQLTSGDHVAHSFRSRQNDTDGSSRSPSSESSTSPRLSSESYSVVDLPSAAPSRSTSPTAVGNTESRDFRQRTDHTTSDEYEESNKVSPLFDIGPVNTKNAKFSIDHPQEITPPFKDNKSFRESLYSRNKKLNMWKSLIYLYRRRTLYSGVVPVVSTLAISNFVYFYAHEVIKRFLLHRGVQLKKESSLTSFRMRALFASTLAGVVNVILTNPLWVANMRIIEQDTKEQLLMKKKEDGNDEKTTTAHYVESTGFNNPSKQKRMSLFSMLVSIARKEGVKKLWSGTIASLVLVSNPAIQHFLYQQMRSDLLLHRLRRQRREHFGRGGTGDANGERQVTPSTLFCAPLGPIDAFVLGAISKAIATTVTYPVQLAQVCLRAQAKAEGENATLNCDKMSKMKNEALYDGAWDCLCKIYSDCGMRGLFAGLDAKLAQTVLTTAFTFATYEQIVGAVRNSYFTWHKR